jgi:hypothetical protein
MIDESRTKMAMPMMLGIVENNKQTELDARTRSSFLFSGGLPWDRTELIIPHPCGNFFFSWICTHRQSNTRSAHPRILTMWQLNNTKKNTTTIGYISGVAGLIIGSPLDVLKVGANKIACLLAKGSELK